MRLTPFTASSVTQQFHDQLVEEHIEEASFLYGQRRAMLAQIDEPWTRLAGLESRIEAHVDALAVAGPRASDRCVARASDAAESGALFVTTCVLCRRLDAGRLANLVAGVRVKEHNRITAIRDAMRVELPSQWASFVESALAGSIPSWVEVFAEVGSHHLLPISRALLSALEKGVATSAVARALGRLRSQDARPALWRCLADANDEARAATLLALVRLGDSDAMLHGVDLARTEAWPREVVALGGGRLAVRTLMRSAQDGDAAEMATIDALGVLGDPEAIATLYVALSSEKLAARAARSLHWITGAALYEESFQADSVDETALTSSELEAWRRAKILPLRSDGQPFGEVVRTLSIDPARWKRWLDRHAGAFQAGSRYRSGRAITPTVAVECLFDPRSDALLRRATGLELEVRYGCDIAFDIEMPVAAQFRALARIRAWASSHDERFSPGQWVFAGVATDGP